MKSLNIESKKIKDETPSLITGVILITISIIIFYAIFFWDRKVSLNTQDWGGFGSFLGGTIGVIFTAGSLIYLAKTLHFERNKSEKDNFDNKFFLMIEITENIKNKITEEQKDDLLNEIDILDYFSLEETLIKSKNIIHKFNSDIGHYYRMLYQILKMINKYERDFSVSKGEISYYTNILRSTLDFKLTQILAINTYYSDNYDEDYKEYSFYCRKYNFFEHMPFSISNNNISKTLIGIYLVNDNGFGKSSFVKKLNINFLNIIKNNTDLISYFDLPEFYIKKIFGKWQSIDKKLKIEFSDNFFKFNFDDKIITLPLTRFMPVESSIRSKLKSLKSFGFEIKFYINENLNLTLEIDMDIMIHSKESTHTKLIINYVNNNTILVSLLNSSNSSATSEIEYENLTIHKLDLDSIVE